ncbi:hypothetical protein O181_120404 [Austropuccinia psidii MF-1]|uniref:Uncharacterized protein n=1 Tax=Austropuccinia psidii MF-1 TaxID=1389203 RepID=A0A9Q3KJ19_9BASI|nr:hypothetical protein [Austropuccinia psidii MF-1]
MSLDQEIEVMNPKHKNASPEERSEQLPADRTGYIPVSVQELVYGRKATRVGTSSKPLDRENELLSSMKVDHGPRKESRPSEWLDTHSLERISPQAKVFLAKPENFVRGPEERVSPKEGQQPSGSSSSLQKQESALTSAKNGQESPKEQSEGKEKGKRKGKVQVEQALPS